VVERKFVSMFKSRRCDDFDERVGRLWSKFEEEEDDEKVDDGENESVEEGDEKEERMVRDFERFSIWFSFMGTFGWGFSAEVKNTSRWFDSIHNNNSQDNNVNTNNFANPLFYYNRPIVVWSW